MIKSIARSRLPTRSTDATGRLRVIVDGDQIRALIDQGWRLEVHTDAASWGVDVADVEDEPASALDSLACEHLLDGGDVARDEARTARYVLVRDDVLWSEEPS